MTPSISVEIVEAMNFGDFESGRCFNTVVNESVSRSTTTTNGRRRSFKIPSMIGKGNGVKRQSVSSQIKKPSKMEKDPSTMRKPLVLNKKNLNSDYGPIKWRTIEGETERNMYARFWSNGCITEHIVLHSMNPSLIPSFMFIKNRCGAAISENICDADTVLKVIKYLRMCCSCPRTALTAMARSKVFDHE